MTPVLLDAMPSSLLALQQKAQHEWSRALQEQHLSEPNWSTERYQTFIRVCTLSDFVLNQAIRNPHMLIDLVASGELDCNVLASTMRQQLSEQLQHCSAEPELLLELRKFRNRQQVRIIWRDLMRQAPLDETCRELSALADTCID